MDFCENGGQDQDTLTLPAVTGISQILLFLYTVLSFFGKVWIK